MSDKQTNTTFNLTKTNSLLLGILVALIVIILGFILLRPNQKTFKTAIDQELKTIGLSDFKVAPDAIAQAILKKDPNMVLVDVRNQFDFAQSHLPEAKNIYKMNLLEKSNISFFENLKKENKYAVLYGNSASEANVSFMILKQMGIENIKYLTVGYDFFFKSTNWNGIAANKTVFDDEKPLVDFGQFILDANKSKITEEVIVAEKPAVVKPKVVVKPKPAESGGNEGC